MKAEKLNASRKGKEGEKRAAKALEDAGYHVTLVHLSRGPFDVVATNRQGVRFIQVKVDDSKQWLRSQPAEMQKVREEMEFPKPENATCELWVSRKVDGRYKWVLQEVFG